MTDKYKTAKILFGTSRAVDIIHSSYYIHGPYKTTVFTFIFAVFLLNLIILRMYIIAQAYINGVAVLQKRTEVILEYYLRFKLGNRRH